MLKRIGAVLAVLVFAALARARNSVYGPAGLSTLLHLHRCRDPSPCGESHWDELRGQPERGNY